MTSPQKYDVIIIGAGQAGLPLSLALAKAGRKTAIIEREHVGGTCINEGCTPTKTMVASARVAYLARRARDYGVETGTVRVDMEKVRQRKRKIVDEFRTSSEGRIERAEGLDWLKGEARFSSRDRVEVKLNDGGQATLTAPIIIINTGGRPYVPPVEGLDKVQILELDFSNGAWRAAGEVAGAWRGLHRAGVRPDVPAVRQPGYGCASRRAADGQGGPRRSR